MLSRVLATGWPSSMADLAMEDPPPLKAALQMSRGLAWACRASPAVSVLRNLLPTCREAVLAPSSPFPAKRLQSWAVIMMLPTLFVWLGRLLQLGELPRW